MPDLRIVGCPRCDRAAEEERDRSLARFLSEPVTTADAYLKLLRQRPSAFDPFTLLELDPK